MTCAATPCSKLQHRCFQHQIFTQTVTHCNTRTDTHGTTLQNTASQVVSTPNFQHQTVVGWVLCTNMSTATFCSTLQHPATHCNTKLYSQAKIPPLRRACGSGCRCVAVCVLQRVAVCCRVLTYVLRVAECCNVLQCVAVVQCVAACCSVLQSLDVCIRVLWCLVFMYFKSKLATCIFCFLHMPYVLQVLYSLELNVKSKLAGKIFCFLHS